MNPTPKSYIPRFLEYFFDSVLHHLLLPVQALPLNVIIRAYSCSDTMCGITSPYHVPHSSQTTGTRSTSQTAKQCDPHSNTSRIVGSMQFIARNLVSDMEIKPVAAKKKQLLGIDHMGGTTKNKRSGVYG